MTQKRRILITAVLFASVCLLLLTAILYLIFGDIIISFAFGASIRLFLLAISIYLIFRIIYKKPMTDKSRKAMILCAAILFLDHFVLDAIRYALNDGVSTILFLPVSYPLCILVIMLFAKPCEEKEKKIWRRGICWVIIPMLILSVYFEVLSFLK